ncbi:MAG: Uma2 family endonuclease [Pirellulales bacterium]
MVVQVPRWQFTVADFARMAEAGIFGQDDRVELIDGEVRAMSPIGPRHAAIVKRLNAMLSRQVAGLAIVSVKDPIQLSDFSEPQPDIAVLSMRDDYYAHSHPLPADVLLLVEVAEKSLEYDREEKVPRYASAGIPEVWLIDVQRETITHYSEPAGNGYRQEQLLRRHDQIASTMLGSLRLALEDIFG